ncbi:MAG: ATP-binding cassette domain-containing protein [Planctomycetes bacterium]|nr:ATP-binding cassette domain-containing protein [Planctomycetota bacterium]
MAAVTLQGVSKVYPGKPPVKAVDRVSLTAGDGEFLVLVGPSGCGKSTTLRMIAGLEAVSEGTISIGDRVVSGDRGGKDVAPKDRDVAMVFQNYALYPHMTIFKNMAFGLKMRKVPKADIRQKVGETANMLGIEHLLNRKPASLSGGERQRVAVGRAIVRTPQAFLFDEPLSNLDARLRLAMRAELKRLHRTLRTTVVYVTHDQEEAMTLGDRVAVMRAGVVHQCAAPVDIYERPVDRFVAEFVGIPPMNFLDGRIVEESGRVVFDCGFGLLDVPEKAWPLLARFRNQAMVFGARPEAFRFFSVDEAGGSGAADSGTAGRVLATVSLVELLGRDKDVYLDLAAGDKSATRESVSRQSATGQLVARVGADVAISEGDRVRIAFDVDRIHVFETGELGMNVTLNGQTQSVVGVDASAN